MHCPAGSVQANSGPRRAALSSSKPIHAVPHLRGSRLRIGVLILLTLTLLLVSGCSRDRDAQELPASEQGSDVAETAVTDATPAPPAPIADRPLTVWVPEFMTVDGDTPAANILRGMILDFEQRHTEGAVEIAVKQQSGPNGMLSFLRSAQEVAPAVLPDVVVLDGQDLWRAVDLGLAKPLTADGLPEAERFFPAARDAVAYQDTVYGVPYAMDLIHAVHTDAQPVPPTWSAVLSGTVPYLFAGAAADPNLNPTLVLQYVLAGGSLAESDIAVDVQTTRALLEFYAQGLSTGTIAEQNSTLTDTDAVWRQLDTETPAIALVSAHAMLAQRDVAERLTYGPPPAATEAQHALAQTYAFVVLTDDPERAALAYELILAFLEPAVLGNWSQFVHYLPATPTALDTWGEELPYPDFLAGFLADGATAIPNGRAFYDYGRRLQAAQNGVLSGSMSVDEAVNMVAPLQ